MAAYGETGPASDYEYDHLIPLELGGAVNDPRNLWPEPGASPNSKDRVEDELKRAVCDDQLTLASAQQIIVTDWLHVPGASGGLHLRPASGTSSPTTSTPAGGIDTGAGTCTLTARYNPRYRDYDIYVRSNQPETRVTVSDGRGDSASWHSNVSGYADVYLKAPHATGGEVTARVGSATCSGPL